MESLFLLAFGEEEFLASLAMAGSEAFFNKLLVGGNPSYGQWSGSMALPDKRKNWWLLSQDKTQEGIVDVDLAVVLDEAQFPEFVHEEIDR
jgi:Tfp pilus assembly protein FimT